MTISESLGLPANSTRSKILDKIDPDQFRWAVPIMRAGYAGRALVYALVGGASIWSLLRGGQAQGTQDVMTWLGGSWNLAIVWPIALGMFAYAIWRLVDSIWDLEAHGTDTKGLIARAGMVVTGAIHGGIGVLALSALGWTNASGGGSGGNGPVSRLMQMPGGPWIIGIVGVITILAGGYYLRKAARQDYLDVLEDNAFTRRADPVLRAGVAAQGIVVAIVGGLIFYAAFQSDASQAGGIGSAFEWLHAQSYGRALVGALCAGLIGFAIFCAVNAAYRIVPKAAGDGTRSMRAALKD